MAIPNELWRLEAHIDFHSVEASHTEPKRGSQALRGSCGLKESLLR